MSAEFGLPKLLLVRKNKEFGLVCQTGKKIVGQRVVIYYLENKLGWTRLGISVSKRIGKATVRNRVKRLMREAFRLNRYRYRPGYDMVWVARSRAVGTSLEDLSQEVNKLLGKVGLYKGNRDF